MPLTSSPSRNFTYPIPPACPLSHLPKCNTLPLNHHSHSNASAIDDIASIIDWLVYVIAFNSVLLTLSSIFMLIDLKSYVNISASMLLLTIAVWCAMSCVSENEHSLPFCLS